MEFYGLRLEYALDGRSNYIAWKDRIEAMLEDNGLKEFIDQNIPKPPTSNEKYWSNAITVWRRQGG